MSETITCPRCQSVASVEVHKVPQTGATLEIDICRGCRGLWLDGSEVALAFRALGSRIDQLREAFVAGSAPRSSTGIGRCPRCASTMVDLPYFDLPLDLCTSCYGLWIDGDEMQALARTADRQAGLPAPTPNAGLRARAAAAVTDDSVACAACGKVVPLDRTLVTALGVRCSPCGRRVNAQRATLDPGDLKSLEEDEEDPEVQLRRSAERRNVLSAIAGVLGTLLNSGRCAHCGCSHHSYCSH